MNYNHLFAYDSVSQSSYAYGLRISFKATLIKIQDNMGL